MEATLRAGTVYFVVDDDGNLSESRTLDRDIEVRVVSLAPTNDNPEDFDVFQEDGGAFICVKVGRGE